MTISYSTVGAQGFSKTLSMVIQKVAADMKNPKLIIQMIEGQKHVDFKKIKPRFKAMMCLKKEQIEATEELLLEYN